MVAAAPAGDGGDLVDKAPKLLRRQNAGRLLLPVRHGVQRSAVSAHDGGVFRADHVSSDLPLEGAEHGVVQKRAALHHHVSAELLAAGTADDLVQRVFHHADGKPGGDILHGGPVLLRLLHGAVHKHRTAGAEIHGLFCEQAEPRKALRRVAQRLRKGLQERPAAGGARLVQIDVVNGAVPNLEAFYILPADVQDEIHVRAEFFRRRVVGDGLHKTTVDAEGVFNHVLAVARHGAAADSDVRPVPVEGFQVIPDNGHGVSVVCGIKRMEDVSVFVAQNRLHRSGAGVDAEKHRPLRRVDLPNALGGRDMPPCERLVLLLRGKQRLAGGVSAAAHALCQPLGQSAKIPLRAHAREGRAQSNIIQ